jgi:hypothetical protein
MTKASEDDKAVEEEKEDVEPAMKAHQSLYSPPSIHRIFRRNQ